MKRRDFLSNASMGLMATGLAAGQRKAFAPGSTGKSRVPGQRYEALVPDTLDLAYRAELALHMLTNWPNPKCEYGVGCGPHGVKLGTKFAEALPMMRDMSGSDLNLEVDKAQLEAYLSLIGEDGLLYTPANTPMRRTTDWGDLGPTDEDYTDPCSNSRMMLTMISHYRRDRDPAWLGRIRKMVKGLHKMTVFKDDYAYYPEHKVIANNTYLKKSGYKSTEVQLGPEASILDQIARPIRPLSQWYAMTGDEKALELARKLKNFVLKPELWEQETIPDIVGSERGHWKGHHWARMLTLRNLLWYARVAKDWRLKEFVRSAYEYTRNFGLPRTGFTSWVGPHPFSSNPRTCESCSLAGIVALAIKLSDAGMGDYWDDVDGVVRNQLTEQQFVDRDKIERVRRVQGKDHPERLRLEWLGGFCGPGHVTSLNAGYPARCCNGNGPTGLYYAWESIVRHQDGAAQVNLLLNRASPWLDVDSYLPYEGKVVIRNKTVQRMSVRIPGWADKKAVEARVNDKQVSSFWVGNYVVFDGLREKDVVTVEFPMVEETVEYTVPVGVYVPKEPPNRDELSRTRYTCHFRGSTLVDISPRDGRRWLTAPDEQPYPIYERDHYKGNRAPMKKVTRYVAPHTVPW